LQQVMVNLLLNAFQAFSEPGTGARPRVVRVRTRVVEENLEVAVEDNGPGLTQGDINKVFEPFYTSKQNGMGMGLSICRTIISDHEGEIWATSTPGQGATFLFTLPLSEGANDGRQ